MSATVTPSNTVLPEVASDASVFGDTPVAEGVIAEGVIAGAAGEAPVRGSSGEDCRFGESAAGLGTSRTPMVLRDLSSRDFGGSSNNLEALLALLRVELTDSDVPQHAWDRALLGPLSEFLSRQGKQLRSRLTWFAWRLAGRTDDPPEILPLLVELLHAGSLIVDDIEDDSRQRRGRLALHHVVGMPVALNTGNWLYFWPASLLAELGLPAELELRFHRQFANTLRQSHEGQALDLRLRVNELSQKETPGVVQAISERKTGGLFALAANLGAAAAGATPEVQAALELFGLRLGVILQMQNDRAGIHPADGCSQSYEDLILRRVTWPWAWLAQTCSPEEFRMLHAQCVRLSEDTNAKRANRLAQTINQRLGNRPTRTVSLVQRQAFADLQKVVGPSTLLDELSEQITSLEQHLG